jgi:hypothetical protein
MLKSKMRALVVHNASAAARKASRQDGMKLIPGKRSTRKIGKLLKYVGGYGQTPQQTVLHATEFRRMTTCDR